MRTEYHNGGDIHAAIKSLKLARNLCVEIERLLNGDGAVHPRDYIGGSESQEYWADFGEYRRVLYSLWDLRQHCDRRTMELYALADQNARPEVRP